MDVIAQLNQYLEEMLECIDMLDRERYHKLNIAYSKLMDDKLVRNSD